MTEERKRTCATCSHGVTNAEMQRPYPAYFAGFCSHPTNYHRMVWLPTLNHTCGRHRYYEHPTMTEERDRKRQEMLEWLQNQPPEPEVFLPPPPKPVIELFVLDDRGFWLFWCPGCGTHHAPPMSRWKREGSAEVPTLSPSVLTKYEDGRVCHLFVRNGQLVYLDDCTHELAGKTVDMEEIP